MDGNGRQFVKYDFFKVRREWFRQVWDEQRGAKDEFAAVVSEMPDLLMTRAYSLVGLRGDADFLLWHTSETLEGLQSSAARLRSTGMAQFLDQPYSYLAMTRQSEYVTDHRHEGQEGTRTKVMPAETKYLIVYPFVKTREWYLLPKEERQRMMSEHFRIGHKYPSVSIHTSYSFGLDDYEFMLGFETDYPGEFLDLVAELRTVEGSMFTKLDTPIFTCVSMSIEEALDSLGGARA
jgi:chlorite dismutase